MKSEVFHDWCLGGSQAVSCGALAVSTGDRKKMRRGKPEGGKKSGFFLRIFSLTIKSRLFSMVFGIFFWFLHNAIILLMERECNVSFFTKKSPGPQRKNEPKKSGNGKKYEASEYPVFTAVKYLTVKKAEEWAAGAFESYFFSQL